MLDYRKLIVVTNRRCYSKPFSQQLAEILEKRPHAVILREKDLAPTAYEALARRVLPQCRAAGVPLFLHNQVAVAKRLCAAAPLTGASRQAAPAPAGLHLGGTYLADLPQLKKSFPRLGISVHSVAEAVAAAQAGAAYLITGHIFATTCKPDLPPRGLDYLARVTAAVPIPVYAIGGITAANCNAVIAAGAAGYCMMSGITNL